jgi:hypothetical protein
VRLGHRKLIVWGAARVRRVNRVIAQRNRVHSLSGQRDEPIAGEHEARGPSLPSGMNEAIHGTDVMMQICSCNLFAKAC